jgi:hypothetical protein
MFMHIARPFTLLCLFLVFSIPAKAAVPKVDFNGDGFADIFLQDIFKGEFSEWFTSANGVAQTMTLPSVPLSSGWVTFALSDFNGDNRTDILWHNIFTGELSVWLTNDAQAPQILSLGSLDPNTGWVPVETKDFNSDGIADVLWRNGFTGELAVWFLSDGKVLQAASLGAIDPKTGWVPINAKDFNGDNRTDILWRNVYTSELSVWLVNDGQAPQAVSLGTIDPSNGWMPVEAKDFNADGSADVLWRNAASGELAIWLLNGGEILQTVSIGGIDPNTGWLPVGVGDFNGDGACDLLWNRSASGELAVWLLSGGQVLQKSSLQTVDPLSGWLLMGIDDYNGDGRSDMFWRNGFTDQTQSWLMNGANILQTQSLNNLPPSSVWQVQIPRG